MDNFKFVYRNEELIHVKTAFEQYNFIVYYYLDKSGMSYFLKKLQLDLCNSEYICFYIDCERDEYISTQIIEQVISGCNKADLLKITRQKSEVTKRIIKSFISTFEIIPLFNIGDVIISLVDAINDTTDVDIEHIADYKIEKAILRLFEKLKKESNFKNVCILIDDANKLSPYSIDFLSKIMYNNFVKVLFTIPYHFSPNNTRVISRLSNISVLPFQIDKTFKRPNNQLIKGLFDCYQKDYKEEYISIFERYERNIHVIMSYIRGFNRFFAELEQNAYYLLKILIILDTSIDIQILERIFSSSYMFETLIDSNDFSLNIQKLENISLIEKDCNQNIYINKRMLVGYEITIPLIEKISIVEKIINVFEISISELTIPQLKFAIQNIDKDYSRRKRYLFVLLSKQKNAGIVEQQYLDLLFHLDSIDELLQVCSMYYNLQVYDVPIIKIKQHALFSNDRKCKILLALLHERLHQGEYSNEIMTFVESSINVEEECLLVSVLFTAYFNEGLYIKGNEILYDNTYKFYYKRYFQCRNYPYLLRNVSYYITEIGTSIQNYNICLSKYKNSDPVNYNRTMSNFICFLMKNDENEHARIVLDEKIKEIEKILEFNDPKYLYLNINYGIYLMRENKGDPSKYFDSILFESGTTETPHIYAKINQALYIAKTNPAKALIMLDDIYYNKVLISQVVPTKTFYQINRLLVEYMNCINNTELLLEIKNNPLRGDIVYINKLYDYYSYRFNNNISFVNGDWKKLFLPGYIFYHGFNPEMLLLTL